VTTVGENASGDIEGVESDQHVVESDACTVDVDLLALGLA
jgi:hypothetical protein